MLIRLAHGSATRVRQFQPGCQLDAGGLAVTWLGDVPAAASAAALAALAGGSGGASPGALAALAASAGPEATGALIRLARNAAAPKLRGQALFWLGQRASRRTRARWRSSGKFWAASRDRPRRARRPRRRTHSRRV